MLTEKIPLRCPRCEHIWVIECPIVVEDGEEVTKIGMFDDLCPKCEAQGEISNVPCKD